MTNPNTFTVTVKSPPCIEGLSTDDVMTLVNSIVVQFNEDLAGRLITSTGGTEVEFQFGPDGSFQGAYAKQNGALVTIIPGTASNMLQPFSGSPSASNPGPGWTVEHDLTRKYLNQSGDENSWEIFYASPSKVLNSF